MQAGGGDDSSADLIVGVNVLSGSDRVQYNFCEVPPSSISGTVFQDGETFVTEDGLLPANFSTLRDGVLTPDDTRIPGVVLELRHTFGGTPVDASEALPGVYPAGPIRTVTGADGTYEFTGLRAGNYTVVEIHPDAYFDFIDTAGTRDGTATLAVIAVATAYGPGSLLAIGLLVLWGIAALEAPSALLVVSVLSLAVSPRYVVGLGAQPVLFGLELTGLHNLFILVNAVPFIARRPLRRLWNPVVGSYLVLLLMTFTVSTPHARLTALQPFRSFAALSLGPALFREPFDARLSRNLIGAIALLAPLSVALGCLLHVLDVYSVYRAEYTGAWRLRGATIPAHLALFGLVGTMVSFAASRKRPAYAYLAILNAVIVILTGTRGSTLAVIIVLAGYLWTQLGSLTRRHPGSRNYVRVTLAVVSVAFVLYLPNLAARFTGNPGEPDFNTSMRLIGWTFFWEEAQSNLVFGQGLGAATVANDGQVPFFRVPHNEYLRILVDGGIVGLILVAGAYVAVFLQLSRGIQYPWKRLFVGCVAAFALVAVVDNPISSQQFHLPFWLFLALLRDGMLGDGDNEAEREVEASAPESGLEARTPSVEA